MQRVSLGSAADLDPDAPDYRARYDAIVAAREDRVRPALSVGAWGSDTESPHGYAYRGPLNAPTPWRRAVARHVLSMDATVDERVLAVMYALRMPRNLRALTVAGRAMRQARCDVMVAPDMRKGRYAPAASDPRRGTPEAAYELSTEDVHDAILLDALEGLSDDEQTLATLYLCKGGVEASLHATECGWADEYEVAVAAVEVARHAVMRKLPSGSRRLSNPRKATGMSPRPRLEATPIPEGVNLVQSAGRVWVRTPSGWQDIGEAR